MNLRILYLIQSPRELEGTCLTLAQSGAAILQLTWQVQVSGAIYLPKSTWTEGRNRLLREARKMRRHHDYYVFLDDDITFERGDWNGFTHFLAVTSPAIGVPYFPWYGPAHAPVVDTIGQTVRAFDAMFNAYKASVFFADAILPYSTAKDCESWWVSQLFVIELADMLIPEKVVQANGVWVNNARHGSYAQGAGFGATISSFEHDALRPVARVRRGFHRMLRRNLGLKWRPCVVDWAIDSPSRALLEHRAARFLRTHSAFQEGRQI